jgi:hypothetical protein
LFPVCIGEEEDGVQELDLCLGVDIDGLVLGRQLGKGGMDGC